MFNRSRCVVVNDTIRDPAAGDLPSADVLREASFGPRSTEFHRLPSMFARSAEHRQSRKSTVLPQARSAFAKVQTRQYNVLSSEYAYATAHLPHCQAINGTL